jgi:transcription elongation GreA/GreB family factor
MPSANKPELLAQLKRALEAELGLAERAARETAEAANHPEAKPEGDKDTRKIELSYLAAGQAARARELETGLALIATLPAQPFADTTPISAGALATLEVGDKTQRVLVSPAGGGLKLEDAGGPISVVTPQSPLGRALLGKTRGDELELVVAGRTSEVVIVKVE